MKGGTTLAAILWALTAIGFPESASANWAKKMWVEHHPDRPIIHACFESGSTHNYAWHPPYQEAIKAGLRNSWETESAMVVNWHADCDETPPGWTGIRITVGDGDENPECGGSRKSCCNPGDRTCWINRKCSQFENASNSFPDFSNRNY